MCHDDALYKFTFYLLTYLCGFIRFLDSKNLGKDTEIIYLARFIEELWMIL